MKVGDLVKYGKWYTGTPQVGLVVEKADDQIFFLVAWPDYLDREGIEELEVISEN